MAYARYGKDGSDVYVYSSSIFYCVECPRLGDVRLHTAAGMAEHLEADRSAGINVPQVAIDRLREQARGEERN